MTDAKVIPLSSRRARRGTALAIVEDLIERVKSGDITEVAIACLWKDGTPGTAWSKTDRRAALLGVVTMMQHDLADDNYSP